MRFTKEQGNGIIIALVCMVILAWAYFGGVFSDEPAAEWYFQKGVEYDNRHQFSEALSYFNQAIHLRPDYAEAYAWRCKSFWGMGRYEEALNDCNQSLHLDSNLLIGYINRCLVFAYTERLEEALQDCNHALSLEPDSSLAFNARGVVYLKSGDNNQALEDLNRAIDLNPNYPNFYFNRGFTYASLELYPEAIADFQHVIELDKSHFLAYSALAGLYYGLGDSEQAFQIADEVVETFPTKPDGFYLRGYLYTLEDRLQEAEADFLRSLELDPNFEEAYLELGYIYVDRGAEERALHFFCQYLELGGEISGYLSFTMIELGECPIAEATPEATAEQ